MIDPTTPAIMCPDCGHLAELHNRAGCSVRAVRFDTGKCPCWRSQGHVTYLLEHGTDKPRRGAK